MNGSAAATEPESDERALRRRFLIGMSHAACTVNVVTTDGAAGRHGVTVSAMVSAVRPLASAVKNSHLVLAHRADRPMSPAAQAFAGHCRSFFGVSHAHTPP